MAITLDGATKVITLDSTSHSAAEIWSRWVDWHASHTQYPLAFTLVGGIPLGGGLFIPPYFFLLNGWRVRPMEASHTLLLDGNLFVDGGGVPVISTVGTYQVNVQYTVPVQAQGIATSGSTGPTAAEIAAAVWANAIRELSASGNSAAAAATLAAAVANPIKSDIQTVRNQTLKGDGSLANPWNPA